MGFIFLQQAFSRENAFSWINSYQNYLICYYYICQIKFCQYVVIIIFSSDL